MTPISFFLDPDQEFPSSLPYAKSTIEAYISVALQWNDFYHLKQNQDNIRNGTRTLSKKSLAFLDKSRRYTQEAMDYLETCLSRSELYVIRALDEVGIHWCRRVGNCAVYLHGGKSNG